MVDNYEVHDLNCDDIYLDPEFNCRGAIAPMDVVDLAKSIEKDGLQFPIAVQPASDCDVVLPSGKKYRILAGHRRLVAVHKINKATTIKAMIKYGLDNVRARILNLSENLHRKSLNILQEAKAIQSLKDAGCPREQVAKELGVSGGWVQVRFYLLDLPEDIQTEAAAGFLNQHQIKQLRSLENDEQMYEAVRKIKTAKERGKAVPHVGKRKKVDPFAKKLRKREEIFEMMEHIRAALGNGLYTRTMAWCAGEINTVDLVGDLKKEADRKGILYHVPDTIL